MLVPVALPTLIDTKLAIDKMDRSVPRAVREAIAEGKFVPLADLLPALPRERTVVAGSTSIELSLSSSGSRRAITTDRELHRAVALLRSCYASGWGHASPAALAAEAYSQHIFVLEASLSLRVVFLADFLIRTEAAKTPSVLWPIPATAIPRLAQLQAHTRPSRWAARCVQSSVTD